VEALALCKKTNKKTNGPVVNQCIKSEVGKFNLIGSLATHPPQEQITGSNPARVQFFFKNFLHCNAVVCK
jgi:hypothetical protein